MLLNLSLCGLWKHRMNCLIRGKHFIKIAHIEDIFRQFRLELRNDLLVKQLGNVDILKPRVIHYLVNTAVFADTLARIFLKALIYEIFAIF